MNTQMIESGPLGVLRTARSSLRLRRQLVLTTPISSTHARKPYNARSVAKLPSLIEWYRILRAHHHWTVFQAIRFALWLGR